MPIINRHYECFFWIFTFLRMIHILYYVNNFLIKGGSEMSWEILLTVSLVYWFFGVIYLIGLAVKLIEGPAVEIAEEAPQLA